MKFKTMIECMDENCRTVILTKHTDGLRCVRCGGPTMPMKFAPLEKTEEKLGTIEQTIINNKKKEVYKELQQLAFLIKDKQHEINLMLGNFSLEENDVVDEFLINIVTNNEIPSDIVLSKKMEQYLLTEGIEELLKKPREVDVEKLAKKVHETMFERVNVNANRL
ncbi:hypothetical protein P9Y62_18705 [Bacillus thuringiensis]|uniref:Uncharacterized protein n=2 Tax=Bacillus thuringiensis TaxID=1428 RepID=A0AAW9J947_BACTU|nr:hypothetical protein [Bacillus thuringiensis]EEM40342.1 hypothetical protein bthur0004_37320 [Bacillus thuringiensis serovar sotto str. T04001]AFQ14918.1 hypothetical protein BTG_07180 [Bacillus thuringiensis HD-771]MDZ5478227.1 hypothetical protein [Bacillus thuringiensis]MEB4894497.1 hypothetical protein [Bacillus thuringiensis]MEC2472769.1 hypothetical protein [Bacillus thuringiensis]